MKLSNKQYDLLKFIVIYVLPFIVAVISIVGEELKLDYVPLMRIANAINVLLSAGLGVTIYNYNKNN